MKLGPITEYSAQTHRAHPPASYPIGDSARVIHARELADRCAAASSPVLLTGETGTGKEVLARYIHASSKRSTGPIVAVNCAALPEHITESVLFGHERGAFTGAVRSTQGFFGEADGGTILLDEVSELSRLMQAKLLRVTEEHAVRRVGGRGVRPVDVRILAAMNEPPEQALADGTLRKDLYFRLSVVEIALPPLRERLEDVPLLAQHFLERHAATNGCLLREISPEVLTVLERHDWPGNVRELENVLERATVLWTPDDGDVMKLKLLPAVLQTPVGDASRPELEEPLRLDWALSNVRMRYAAEALRRTNGNRTGAARLLGISRRGLYNLLDRLERGDAEAPTPRSTRLELASR